MAAPELAVVVPSCATTCPLVRMMLVDLARRAGVNEQTMAAMWGLDLETRTAP